jgi:hypothetical protein
VKNVSVISEAGFGAGETSLVQSDIYISSALKLLLVIPLLFRFTLIYVDGLSKEPTTVAARSKA